MLSVMMSVIVLHTESFNQGHRVSISYIRGCIFQLYIKNHAHVLTRVANAKISLVIMQGRVMRM